MSEKEKSSPSPEDLDLERKIRSERKFSLAEAIGRLGGSGLLKGTSPIPQKRQSELKIEQYLERHLTDSEGALEVVLLRQVRESDIFLEMNFSNPLAAIASYLVRVLDSEARLQSFVRTVDAEWGRMYLERPHFQQEGLQQEGQSPDEDDPYTFASVRKKLERLLDTLLHQQ